MSLICRSVGVVGHASNTLSTCLVNTHTLFHNSMVNQAEEDNGWESDVDPMDQEMQRYGLTPQDLDRLTQSRERWRTAKGPDRTAIGRETYIQILDSRSDLKDDRTKKGERTRKMLRDVRDALIERPRDADANYRVSGIGIMFTVAPGNREKNFISSKDGLIGWL